MYEATKKKNEKLGGLDNQMVKVEEDFEEMMRKRNEEKKKLELKFKDVYQQVSALSVTDNSGKSKTSSNTLLMKARRLMIP